MIPEAQLSHKSLTKRCFECWDVQQARGRCAGLRRSLNTPWQIVRPPVAEGCPVAFESFDVSRGTGGSETHIRGFQISTSHPRAALVVVVNHNGLGIHRGVLSV